MPRPISIVHVTPDFEKSYLRLPKHIQNLAARKDQWFHKNAFDPRLRTHKLKGEPILSTESIAFHFDSSAQAKPCIMMSALMKLIANIFFTSQISIFHVSGIPETWKFTG